jgi:hypothetical protein
MHLSRDDILKAEDRRTEEVQVPEWGGTVLVQGMSGQQRDEFEASMLVRRGGQMVTDVANVRAKIVAWCVVDDDGQRLFTASDVDALGRKSAAALNRVHDVATRLSGLRDEDVEELTGNFGAAPGGDSSSGSPGNSAPPPRGSSAK